MRINLLRISIFCLMLSMLCAGIILQNRTANRHERLNAILVMAQKSH